MSGSEVAKEYKIDLVVEPICCIYRIVECEVKYADTVPEGRVELVVKSCVSSVGNLGAVVVVTVVEVAKVVVVAVVVSAMVVVVAVGVSCVASAAVR